MGYLNSFNTIEEYENAKDNLPLNSIAVIKGQKGFIMNPNPDEISVVSVANLKSVNGETIVGKGNIEIEGFIPLSRDFSDDFNNDFAN